MKTKNTKHENKDPKTREQSPPQNEKKLAPISNNNNK